MIDDESKQFIDWTINQMQDDTYFMAQVNEAKDRINQFYMGNKAEILAKLRAKMTRGAEEHGAPQVDNAIIHKELENEYIDLLGWMVIERWNALKKD